MLDFKKNLSLFFNFRNLLFTLLSTIFFILSCSGSSNERSNYNLDLNFPQCGVHIRTSFTTHLDLCEFISYEARLNTCLYYGLLREYRRRSCNMAHFGLNSGPHDNSAIHLPPTQFGIQIVTSQPLNLVEPIVDSSTPWNDLINNRSILDYYSMDDSNCLARVHGTDIVIDTCLEIEETQNPPVAIVSPPVPTEPEKDDEVVDLSEPNQGRTPAPSGQRAGRGQPQADTAPIVTNSTTGATPPPEVNPGSTARPATQDRLEYNLITFNDRTLRYDEIPNLRLPILRITGNIDANSPIYNLRHSSPNDILTIILVDIETTCPLKTQLSTSGSTIILTLLSEAGSTSDQIESCRLFFDSIAELAELEFSFSDPLRMTNGTIIDQPFIFRNE